MNATRYYSLLHKEYERPLNVGRVLSPTMAMIIDREKEIEMLVSETYYTANLNVGGLIFEGRHFESEEEANRIIGKAIKL